MAHVKEFERKLDDLWQRRASTVLSLVKTRRKPGRQKVLTKAIRNKRIAELKSLSTKILLKEGAKEEFRALVRKRRRKHLSGRRDHRYETLWNWAQDSIRPPFIYSFWNGNRCLYVGQARSARRFRSYRNHGYLRDASAVKVHEIRGKSALGKAECLAIHIFNPKENRARAAKRKHGGSCPICRAHDQIEAELNMLFKLR